MAGLRSTIVRSLPLAALIGFGIGGAALILLLRAIIERDPATTVTPAAMTYVEQNLQSDAPARSSG
jgi:hypothetical protein